MTESAFPFDTGPGANVLENSWQKMAREWLATGVITGRLNQLAVSADGSALAVSVASGQAQVEGFFYENDAALSKTLATANATNPRVDTVVVRLDRTANTCTVEVLTGTAAASPTATTLTQTDELYELPLADVEVPAAAGVIVAGNVTDRRAYTKNLTTTAANAAYLAKAQNLADVPDKAAARANLGIDAATTPVEAKITTQQTGITGEVAVTGLSKAITVPAGRRVKVTLETHIYSTASNDGFGYNIKQDGTTISGAAGRTAATANREIPVSRSITVTPAAGTHTFTVSLLRTEGTGGLANYATAALPATLLVEDIGAAA